MSRIEDVTALPEAEIKTPPTRLSAPEKVWHMGGGVKAETSVIYSMLATIAGRTESWGPVNCEDLWNLAEEDSGWLTFRQNMFPLLAWHTNAGFVRIVKFKEEIYVLPLQALLDHINGANGDRPFM